MQSTLTTPEGLRGSSPVMVAAELQDSLLVVMHDLHRLEGLLNHATDNLLERFGEANAVLQILLLLIRRSCLLREMHYRSAVSRIAVSGHGVSVDLAHHQSTAGLCLSIGFGGHGTRRG